MQLRPFQVTALQQISEQRRLIYADPIGAGKTVTSVSALDAVNSGRALILAPTYVLDHWMEEGERWSPGTQMILGSGTATKRRRAREALREVSGPAALVLNYESAWRDEEFLRALGFDTLICDEAHRLKERTTSTFKGVSKLARRLPNVILVTGTPILNRADECWSALHLLHPHRFSSFHRWSEEHFEIELGYFNGRDARPVRMVKDLKKGHAEKIKAELGPVLLMRSYEEIEMDLPDLVETVIEVELTAPERKAYDELTNRSWTRVEGQLVQTVNEVAKITRQRQLASDWSQLAGRDVAHGAKMTATLALAKDLEPEQVLIVALHKAAVETIAHELDAPFVHGDVKPSARDIEMARFKTGTARVLVATMDSIGEGVDGLQVARHLIMLDGAWNPAGDRQIIGRLRRSGQRSTVHVHRVRAKNTIDNEVDAMVESKATEIHSVTGAPS